MKKKIKKSYNLFFKNLNSTIKLSAFLSFILILIFLIVVLVLMYVPYSSFWGMLFVLLIMYLLVGIISPYIYSFYLSNYALYEGTAEDISLSGFIISRKAYKNRIVRHIFNLFRILLIACLIYILLEGLSLSIIVYGYGANSSGALNNLLKEFNALMISGNTTTLISDINNLFYRYEDTIRLVNGITSFISILPALIYFLYQFSLCLMYLHISTIYVSERIVSYKRVLKEKELNYFKGFYSISLPYLFLAIIIFSACFFLMLFYLPKASISLISISSLTVSIFFLLPFFPVILNYNEMYRTSYMLLYINKFMSVADSLYASYNNEQNLSNNDKFELKNLIDITRYYEEMKKSLLEKKEKEKRREENELDK